jgi:CBS domain-containing protein
VLGTVGRLVAASTFMNKLRVNDLMSVATVAVRPPDSIARARQWMKYADVRHLPVIEGSRCVGIVSDRDLLRAQLHWKKRMRVSDLMTANPKTVTPETEAAKAAKLLVSGKISALPVVENGPLVGILTATDFVRQAWLER